MAMPEPFRFIHLTDCHISTGVGRVRFGTDTSEAFRRVLDSVPASTPVPDFVLVTGDLVSDGRAASYEAFHDRLRTLSCPVRYALGKHDNRSAFRRVVLKAEPSLDPYYHSFQANGFDFLVLDSWLPGNSAGSLDAGQLKWLRARLATSRDAVVCIHHHFAPTGLAWLDRLILWNRKDLESLLRSHPGVLFGHIHRAFDANLDAAPLLGTPATCYQFGPRSESREIGSDPPAFRIVSIDEGRVATEVRWMD
jgi:3',5'-cyclic-AMP phosphodiesterase